MAPHDYVILGHKRSEIGRWIGISSVFLAPLCTHILTWASQAQFLTASVNGKLATMTVSTGLIYLALYWIFNRFGWRWLDRFLRIPDLSGRWQVKGTTLNQDGITQFEWDGELVISQKWDCIAIELKTSHSRSYSETASLLTKHDDEIKLSYSYQNHPQAGEAQLQKHQGFCELIFDAPRGEAAGYYFNSFGRLTFGKMELTKIV
jgi:hypothetical protein